MEIATVKSIRCVINFSRLVPWAKLNVAALVLAGAGPENDDRSPQPKFLLSQQLSCNARSDLRIPWHAFDSGRVII